MNIKMVSAARVVLCSFAAEVICEWALNIQTLESLCLLFLRSTTLLMGLHRLGVTGLNVCGYIHVSFELFLIKLSTVLVGITPSGQTPLKVTGYLELCDFIYAYPSARTGSILSDYRIPLH